MYFIKKDIVQDLPGGLVAKTSHSQFREPRFNPCSGNYISPATTNRSKMLKLRPGAVKQIFKKGHSESDISGLLTGDGLRILII